MKLNSAKGQAALEYMVTYGWMLLVVGVVLVVLWQYGAFDLGRSSVAGCTGFSQISVVDQRVYSAGTDAITLNVINNAGTKILLNTVNVSFAGVNCPYTVPSGEMRAGQSLEVTVPNSCGVVFYQGENYRADIVFDYTVVTSTINHLSAGECHGPVE